MTSTTLLIITITAIITAIFAAIFNETGKWFSAKMRREFGIKEVVKAWTIKDTTGWQVHYITSAWPGEHRTPSNALGDADPSDETLILMIAEDMRNNHRLGQTEKIALSR